MQRRHGAVLRAMPGPALLLTPDLVMGDANDAFLERSGRDCGDLVGRSAFEVFPVDPADSDVPGSRLRASVDRVLTAGRQDTMPLRRYDLESPGAGGSLGGAILDSGERAGSRPGRAGGTDHLPGGRRHRTGPHPRRLARGGQGPQR